MTEFEPSAGTAELVEALHGPRRLGQQLATLLAGEIVSGRIAVGQAFPSAEEIVSRFRVSRTVAREAVQTLAMVGLVRVQHGKRTEVMPREEWDILSWVVQAALRREGGATAFVRDLYELRLVIEPQAAAWTAEHGSERDLAELERLVRTMEELARSELHADRLLAADRDFHNLVARASGNTVLAAVSRDIREILTTLWALTRLGPAERRTVAEQHRLIAGAIARRDPDAAAEAMRAHLVWASEADLTGLASRSEPHG